MLRLNFDERKESTCKTMQLQSISTSTNCHIAKPTSGSMSTGTPEVGWLDSETFAGTT